MILRCTKKLRTVIGGSRFTSSSPEPSPEDWYANLLWFDRRKCLLLTHAATLFSVLEVDITVADLRGTGALTASLIGRELRNENLPAETFTDIGTGELILTDTADRQVLGCMNDMAFTCEYLIGQAGGLRRADFGDLNRHLHRTIYSARGYRPAIELAANRISGRQ